METEQRQVEIFGTVGKKMFYYESGKVCRLEFRLHCRYPALTELSSVHAPAGGEAAVMSIRVITFGELARSLRRELRCGAGASVSGLLTGKGHTLEYGKTRNGIIALTMAWLDP